jgi:hypothetical protein
MNQTDASNSSNRWGGLIELGVQQLVQIALLGIGLGAGFWLLTQIIRQVILVPLLCGDPTTSACLAVNDTSGSIAGVIVAIIGVLGLVRLSVYRPLIIVVAAAISLWGLSSWIAGLQWYEGLAAAIILYVVSYVAFSWLVRPRAFVPAMVIVIVVVVLARFIPTL